MDFHLAESLWLRFWSLPDVWASTLVVVACLIAMRAARRSLHLLSLVALVSTVLHEGAHWVVGALILAKPQKLSLTPRRLANGWELGSVTCRNLHVGNAVFVGLAPLLLGGVAWGIFECWMRPLFVEHHYARWLLAGYAVASALFGSLPSQQDIKVAAGSGLAYSGATIAVLLVLYGMH